MKNYSLAAVFTLVAGALCWFGLPWWFLAVGAGLSGFFFKNRPLGHFGTGFGAGSLLWGSLAAWLNSQNGGMLATKIGQLFQGLSVAQLIWATGALGGLIAGMGALTGCLLRAIFEKKKKRQYF